MEFTLRAGEDRPSSYSSPSLAGTDGYFTAQALRGGYLGSGLRRSDPLQNPMMIPTREAVLRELEKERIREEIIASEILRKRELEEEVRRELAYEREVGLRMQASEFSLQGRDHIHKPKEVKKEWSCALCRVSTSSEQALKKHLQDKKHKAKEEELIAAGKRRKGIKKSGASSSAAPKRANKSQFPKQFGGVTTNGQQKKSQQVPQKQNGEEVKQHPLRGEEDVKQHPLRREEEVKQHPFRRKEEVKQHPLRCKEDVKQHPLRCKEEVKKHPFRCKHCNVKCNSRDVFVSHVHGKKHLARMQELKASVTKGNEESRADMQVKQKRAPAQTEGGGGEGGGGGGRRRRRRRRRRRSQEEEEEEVKANNKAGASNKKGPNMKKSYKPKVVMKFITSGGFRIQTQAPSEYKLHPPLFMFMTTSHSKGQQKAQVGQSEQPQQVPEKQNGTVKVKKHPVLRKHCKVKLLCVKKYNVEYKV